MQVQPFTRGAETHEQDGIASSVALPRQEIPVALLTDKERRASAVGRRARLSAAHGDQVWHRRYRGGREINGLDGADILARRFAASMRAAQEQTGTVGPAGDPERIGKVFANDRNLTGFDQRNAQHGSVPDTGSHRERARAARVRRNRIRQSTRMLMGHGRNVALSGRRTAYRGPPGELLDDDRPKTAQDATSTGSNRARPVSHKCRHSGQNEHCVSARSSVMKACGEPHRGQLT